MFSIKVNSAFELKNYNIVVIEGQVEGSLENGGILIEKDKPEFEYVTKGVVLVDGKNVKHSADRLNIQLVSGNYKAEDLVGKTLINKE